MANSLNPNFQIIVEEDGRQYPSISIGDSNFEMLSNLALGHMSRSKGVRKELDGLEAVLGGSKEVHSFGGDDWCIIDFRKERSTIINGFDEFEPVEIDSKIVLDLLQDWYFFLLSYENGEIPGIIFPDR